MDSKHRDVASKVASMLEAVVAATRNQTTVVDKISAIWKTTISAPAMHRLADRDAAARIANSYYSLLFCFEHGHHAPCSFFYSLKTAVTTDRLA